MGYEDVLWLDSYVAIDEVSLSEWLSVRVCVLQNNIMKSVWT